MRLIKNNYQTEPCSEPDDVPNNKQQPVITLPQINKDITCTIILQHHFHENRRI